MRYFLLRKHANKSNLDGEFPDKCKRRTKSKQITEPCFNFFDDNNGRLKNKQILEPNWNNLGQKSRDERTLWRSKSLLSPRQANHKTRKDLFRTKSEFSLNKLTKEEMIWGSCITPIKRSQGSRKNQSLVHYLYCFVWYFWQFILILFGKAQDREEDMKSDKKGKSFIKTLEKDYRLHRQVISAMLCVIAVCYTANNLRTLLPN